MTLRQDQRQRAVQQIEWSSGQWLNPPVRSEITAEGTLIVEAKEGSDAWQKTSYGFVHTSQHALLRPFVSDSAVEVELNLQLDEQFDQAGVFIYLDDEKWIKAGFEFSDGLPWLGAVVTDGYSDWSTGPVPDWNGKTVVVRASWTLYLWANQKRFYHRIH